MGKLRIGVKSKASVAAIATGIIISSLGCSLSADEGVITGNVTVVDPVTHNMPASVTASFDVKLEFDRTEIVAVSGTISSMPTPASPVLNDERTSSLITSTTVGEEALAPVTVYAPIRAEAKVKSPMVSSPVKKDIVPELPASASALKEIHVALRGGLDVLDQYRGPVLYDFPPDAGIPPYVAEHDLVGGWERFGSLKEGMTIKMTGLVTGTYTVGEIINVPQGGEVSELLAFSTRPKVMLQTCVPWTDRMIVVGLY